MLQETIRAYAVAASLCLWGLVALGAADEASELVLVHDSTQRLDFAQLAYYKVPESVAPANKALRVEVESLSGDADLYLAPFDQVARPSFDNYALKSATYGLEVIEVPVTFQRPLAIGVFADAREGTVVYRLRVFVDHWNSVDEYERVRIDSNRGAKSYEEFVATHLFREDPYDAGAASEEDASGASSGGRTQGSGGGASKNPRSTPRVEEKSSWVLTLIFHILEFLVEVLL